MAVCTCPDSTSPASNRLEIINALIDRGVNTEAVTNKRQTAFMYAASNGNVQVLERLIPLCNIHAEDSQGWTALHWAANSNKSEAVRLLIDAGLSHDKIDIHGNTALHYALEQNFEDVFKILSEQESDDEKPQNILADFYEFEDIFKDLSPQFFRDIFGLLYGMRCEQLSNYFSGIDLLEFLSLDDNGLKELGIELPYQRLRILTGLHKFHGHSYKPKSIPLMQPHAICSTIYVGNVLVAAVRQLIAMEASIKYISHIGTDENVRSMEIPMRSTIMSLQQLRKTAKALHLLTRKWDSQIQVADLIKKADNQHIPRRWFKYLGCISILTVTVLIFRRTKI